MNERAYYQCDCGELTQNDDAFCSEPCREKYNRFVLNKKTNHVVLPEPRFTDINTTLIESCELASDIKIAKL
jgi:hypothetical protein